MEILKLLSLFNIECKLSDQLLKLDVDDCLKNAKFTIVEDILKFDFDDYHVKIDPSNKNKTIVESQDANPEEGLPFGSFCCYGWDGSITSIS